MKRHERCSISGSASEIEIPLLLSFLYLLSCAEVGTCAKLLEESMVALNGAPYDLS